MRRSAPACVHPRPVLALVWQLALRNVVMWINLEPFIHADIDRLVGWVPSSKFLLQWAGSVFRHPLDRGQLKRHLARAAGAEPDCLVYKAIDRATGEAVGHGELAAIDRRNLSAAVARILVGPPQLRGQGIGAQIVRVLLCVAFDDLALHRVALHVFDFNAPAIRCYEKLGFRKEGTLREARRHGDEYWNVHVMGILEQEWRSRL